MGQAIGESLLDKTPATSAESGDKMYIVQGGVDKQIDVADMPFGGGSLPSTERTGSGDTYTLVQGGTKKEIDYDNLIGSSSVIAANDVDWATDTHYTKTLSGNTTLTFSNIVIYKTITLEITGSFTLTLPTTIPAAKYSDYDGTKINLIHIYCIDDSSGTEKYDVILNKVD